MTTNFLGNLVDKTFNKTEALQPRLASLFEPSPMTGWPATGRLPNPETADDVPSTDEATTDVPAPSQPLMQHQADPTAAPAGTRPEPPQHSPLTIHPSPLTIFQPPIRHTPAEPPSLNNQPPTTEHQTPDPQSAPLITPSVAAQSVQPAVPPVPDPPEPALTPSPLPLMQPLLPTPAAARPELEPRRHQAAVEPGIALAETPMPGFSSPKTEPTRSALEGENQTSSETFHHSPFTIHHSPFTIFQPPPPTPQPLPTIQVTIGRIDVRAAPPVAAAREKKQTGPTTMSLDEYLRQRNGGQR